MGATIWCLSPSTKESGDDFDHGLFLDSADALDALAENLGVLKLSSFFDYTDAQLEFLEDEGLPVEAAVWHPPQQVLASLDAVIAGLASDTQSAVAEGLREPLLEELRDCRVKIQKALTVGEGVHFCIVM